MCKRKSKAKISGSDNINIQNSVNTTIVNLKNGNPLTILNALGNSKAVEDTLNLLIRSLEHPTHPSYYKVVPTVINDEIRLYSKPKNEKASKIFPQRLRGHIIPPNPEKYPYIDEYTHYADYAFNTQKAVDLRVKDIKQYIGKEADPYPLLRDSNLFRIEPYSPFPEARKSTIACGQFSITTKIRRFPDPRKNILVLVEEDNSCMFSLKLTINLITKDIGIEFSIKEEYTTDTYARYMSLCFFYELANNNALQLIDMEFEKPVLEGNVVFDINQENQKELLDCYEILLTIEKKLNVKFIHPKEEAISWDLSRLLRSISAGFNDEFYKQEVLEIKKPFVLDSKFNTENLKSLNSLENIYITDEGFVITLFNHNFNVLEQVELIENFKLANYKELVKSIKKGKKENTMVLVPKDNNTPMIYKRKIII